MLGFFLKLKSEHSPLASPIRIPFVFSENNCEGWLAGTGLELGWRVCSQNVLLDQLRSES